MLNNTYCLNCKEELSGRSDKKFCDAYCKSQFHYEKQKHLTSPFYKLVENQLRLNRKILKYYNRSGVTILRAEILKKEGFNPKYFTHYWKNYKGDIYLFVYEFGFLSKKDHNIEKYVLVKHQSYMQK